jgi:WD40 repeat protein
MNSAAALTARGVRFALDAPVLHALNTGEEFMFATGDGAFHQVATEDAFALQGHRGISLALVAHPDGFALSGGDDGRVLKIDTGGAEELFTFGRDWPNAIAVASETALTAIAVGKRVHIYDRGLRQTAAFDYPYTVGGVAFDPKGKRIAASHYGGVSVRMATAVGASARLLRWKGSHLAVTWSPCGRFIVTSMQENAIHGWRIEDAQHFRMDGYPQRVRSFDWLDRGRKLATTGAGAEVLLWPFVGPKGPMGRAAEALSSPAETDAVCVAARPGAPMAAVGYRDGSLRLFSLSPQAGYTLEEATGAAVSALAWAKDGKALVYGREDGAAGLVRVS